MLEELWLSADLWKHSGILDYGCSEEAQWKGAPWGTFIRNLAFRIRNRGHHLFRHLHLKFVRCARSSAKLSSANVAHFYERL